MKNKYLIYGAVAVAGFLGYKKYSQNTSNIGASNKTTDDLKSELEALRNSATSSSSEIAKLQKEIERREAEKQKRLAEIERLKGSKTSDDFLKKQNADLLRKIADLEKQMGINEARNKRILSEKEKELLDQIAKLKASITTKEDLIQTINAKREAKVEMERLKTLEDFIGNSQETIDRLTKTLNGIDTSTKSGQERAKLYIDLIKKAEARKVKQGTSTKTIIELGLGRTGYQTLLPKATWTLNDLLDDSKHIQVRDKFSTKNVIYEFYPVDADVELYQKGNWNHYVIVNGKKLRVSPPFDNTKEKMILSSWARDPRRYEVRVAGKE